MELKLDIHIKICERSSPPQCFILKWWQIITFTELYEKQIGACPLSSQQILCPLGGKQLIHGPSFLTEPNPS